MTKELTEASNAAADLQLKLTEAVVMSTPSAATTTAPAPAPKAKGSKKGGKGSKSKADKSAAALQAAAPAQSELLDVDDIDTPDGGSGAAGGGGAAAALESAVKTVFEGGQSLLFLAINHRAVWLFGLAVYAIHTRGDMLSV